MIKAIVTDIEGTTGSIHFVHQVLFPYAKQHLPQFVRQQQHHADVAEQIAAVKTLMQQPEADIEAVIAQLIAWIEADQKITPLKALQGLVWEAGYQTAAYKGHVYEDAYQQLQAWREQGLALYIYSSGSVYAQKLLFGFSEYGDLTPWFKGYFDTQVGGKREAQSYENILKQIDFAPEEVLFLSDVVEELDAAQQTGMKTVQLVREPNMTVGSHPQVPDFMAIDLHQL